jgi:hypothetical protein
MVVVREGAAMMSAMIAMEIAAVDGKIQIIKVIQIESLMIMQITIKIPDQG